MSIESLWIEIFINNSKSYLVGCFYRPPEGSNYLQSNYNDLLNDQLTQIGENTTSEIIILGDFNIDYNVKSTSNEYKSIMDAHGLKQLVNECTRITDTSATSNRFTFLQVVHKIYLSLMCLLRHSVIMIWLPV